MSPEQRPPESDDEGAIAADLRGACPEPRPAFAGELGRRVGAAAPGVPPRPPAVVRRVGTLAGAGGILLVLAAIAGLA